MRLEYTEPDHWGVRCESKAADGRSRKLRVRVDWRLVKVSVHCDVVEAVEAVQGAPDRRGRYGGRAGLPPHLFEGGTEGLSFMLFVSLLLMLLRRFPSCHRLVSVFACRGDDILTEVKSLNSPRNFI